MLYRVHLTMSRISGITFVRYAQSHKDWKAEQLKLLVSVIWLSNLLTLSEPDEGYSIYSSCALNLISIYFIFFVKYQFSCFFFFIIKPRNTYVTRDDMSKYQQSRNKISTKISLFVYPRKLTGLYNNSKAKAVLLLLSISSYIPAFSSPKEWRGVAGVTCYTGKQRYSYHNQDSCCP
jgi:hypothetical protein